MLWCCVRFCYDGGDLLGRTEEKRYSEAPTFCVLRTCYLVLFMTSHFHQLNNLYIALASSQPAYPLWLRQQQYIHLQLMTSTAVSQITQQTLYSLRNASGSSWTVQHLEACRAVVQPCHTTANPRALHARRPQYSRRLLC